MTNVQTQIAELNQSAFQAFVSLANLSVENAERFIYMTLESAKSTIEESAEQAKALAEVKDVQELAALRAKAAEASLEKALAYSRGLYELANETQAKVVEMVEEQFNMFNQNVVAVVENVARSAPVGAEAAVAAFKSSFATTAAGVDSFKRAAKQAAELTDNAVRNAQRTTTVATKNDKNKK
jgi:phasin family protein